MHCEATEHTLPSSSLSALYVALWVARYGNLSGMNYKLENVTYLHLVFILLSFS